MTAVARRLREAVEKEDTIRSEKRLDTPLPVSLRRRRRGMADCTTVTGGAKWGRKGVKKRWGMGECTILDKRGKRKKIPLNSEGQNWVGGLNMELLARPLLRIRYGRKSRTWFRFPLLTVFSLQSDSLATPFASLRLGARPSLFLGLSWPGLRYGTLPLLTALASRQAVPPSGLRFHRSLPRSYQGAWLTALCARKAVPPRWGCLRQYRTMGCSGFEAATAMSCIELQSTAYLKNKSGH
jgi:hypothetical protein